MEKKGGVLVTGGAGFIGTNLVRTLVARRERVVVLDNEFLGRISNLDGVDCTKIKGDAADAKLVERIVGRHRIDRVAHFAGYTSAPMYSNDPKSKILENFEQFVTVLDAAREHQLKVVYASTSSFYARSPKPFREDAAIVPATPYELSKYIMEQAAHTYQHEYGVVARRVSRTTSASSTGASRTASRRSSSATATRPGTSPSSATSSRPSSSRSRRAPGARSTTSGRGRSIRSTR
ncbi:MAG: NAD-dependent epimerase/dehydratase family protein [Euryarchaeota archaeon]|nr:NAD-dependent epimerase/dehydratase family protein [Euryarchaeota archaeon]